MVVTFKKNQNKLCGCWRETRGRKVCVDRGRGRGNRGGETEVREREKERAEGGVLGGKEGWRGCPGDARQKLERRRTGYSPGRGLFYMSAHADSSGQEFRSSFCHCAYA